MNIYYASPFFEQGTYNKSKQVVEAIRKEFGDKVNVYLPQENGDINDKKDMSKLVTARDIANGDNYYLERADLLIADLDGLDIDSGVSAEIGYVAGKNKLAGDINFFISLIYEDWEKEGLDYFEDIVDLDRYTENKHTNIIGFNTDIRINKTDRETLKLIRESEDNKALDIIDNLKVNNLYRNLYTIGLVEEWGEYIVSQDNYIEEIIKAIKEMI